MSTTTLTEGSAPGRHGPPRRRRVAIAALAATTLVAPLLVPVLATPVAADTAPAHPDEPPTVSADALPTVQINGVVWDQVVVGDRVYATGEFTQARPAGAAPGQNETPRSHILAYNLHTGALIQGWAPSLNAQGLTLAASEDGSTIYVGGDFDQVNGQWRSRVAALDAETGELLPLAPLANSRVDALAVHGNTLYIGGYFTTMANQPRSRLAAVNATTGALLPWAPVSDREVVAMVVHESSGRVIVGGNFFTLNGTQQYGMGSLDGTTGAVMPWAANQVIQNRGEGSMINDLATDGENVYGVGWAFFAQGAEANFEGSFSADALTGELHWINGCRGDNYGVTVQRDVVYSVGHPHDCGMVGGHPQTEPWTFQRAQAINANGSLTGNTNAFGTPSVWQPFAGRPAPDLLHWLPSLTAGTYTGLSQGAWTVASNDDYVVLGGEFPRANGTNQQGLVRYARREIAPNRDPILGYPELQPTLQPLGPGTVRVGWIAPYDRDNARLTYEVLRGATTATSTVLTTFAAETNWWTRPPMGFVDTTAPPGSSQTYRIRVRDPYGNGFAGPASTVTIPTGSPVASDYRAAVRADGATHLWRLGETSGTTARDWANANDVTLNSAVQRNVAGALLNEANRAATFPASTSTSTVWGATSHSQAGPQTFSLEAWFRTTSTQGGKIMGFGNSRTGRSNTNGTDRHLYLTNNGQIRFGVRPDMGTRITINSTSGFNDGAWHYVVGTLDGTGMRLYVDGELVVSNANVTKAQVYWGYWRVGGDQLSSWPSTPSREALAATLDEVAVYSTPLSLGQVRAHYQASGRDGGFPNLPPVAAFTASTADLTVTVDGSGSTDPDGTIETYQWDFGDGQAATGVTASHTYAAAGDYTVTLTVTDDDGDTDTVTDTVTVTDPPPGPVQFARDSFERSQANGWGDAEVGGPWTVNGPAANFSVSGGVGRIAGTVAANRAAYLEAVSRADINLHADLTLDTAASGGGAYVSMIGRRVSNNNDYRAKVRYLAGGGVALYLVRTLGGAETVLASATLGGITYTPGDVLHTRLQITGTTTTSVSASVWAEGQNEPTSWLLTGTDATPAALQAPGGLGVALYTSGSWAGPAATLTVDDLRAEDPALQ